MVWLIAAPRHGPRGARWMDLGAWVSLLKQALRHLTGAGELPLAPGERRRTAPAVPRSTAGAAAEDAATTLLTRHGYRVIARNRANAIGEIDVVCRKDDTIVFVEVRSRTVGAIVDPKDTITRAKARRLAKTAELFLRQHRLSRRSSRIDLVTVEMDEEGRIKDMVHLHSVVGQDGR